MKAYQLKIQIKNSHPPIWRRVIVPAGLSFAQLAIILNQVMGWCGYHLSSFEFYHLGIQIEEKIEDDFDDMMFDRFSTMDMAETMIDPYLDSEEWFSYVYDFGDWWDHRVTVEKILDDYDKSYPQIIKFKGETPYEDCGGIYGYYELLEILKDPAHPEHEESKAWTEDHFTNDQFDMAYLNEELEECFSLTGQKSEPVSLRELYERYFDGEPVLDHVQGVWEIGGPALSESDEEEAAEALMRALYERMDDTLMELLAAELHREHTLEEIFTHYTKEELTDIARINNLKGFTKYNKKDLITFLCDALIQKDVMERYFKYVDQEALGLFDEEDLTIPVDFDDGRLDELLDGGYIGFRELANGGIALIPRTVRDAYRAHFSGDWYEKAAEDRRLLCYLNGLTRLYGICPLEKIIEIYRLHLDISLTRQEISKAYWSVPENKKSFVLRGDRLILKRLDDAQVLKGLEAQQQNKEYYIPSIKEIQTLGKQSYLPFDKHMKELERYLTELMDDDKQYIKSVCAEVQYIIRIGGRTQDVVDFLEDILFDYDDMPDDCIMNQQFIEILQDVWNHTRMTANRGHHPQEMFQEQMRQMKVPNNVIPFPGSRRLH